ncbi:hypothetical protein [Mucilaginibacter sp. SMC90]|uniref:hypothetical protein n=1 Tax=Mucilaginibacter sp. SMC90 TaxID=2929803 RepID=UPI0035301105
MRSIWKGSIGFGLVSILIKLYSAMQTSSLDLDMLDSRDYAHIYKDAFGDETHLFTEPALIDAPAGELPDWQNPD